MGVAEMLQLHHKHAMRSRTWPTCRSMQFKCKYCPMSLKPCPHHREWASQASCGTCDTFHQEGLVKWHLLVTSSSRNAAWVLGLTFGVRSVLCLQICPYRHEFPNILLRDFYTEEIPLVEALAYSRKKTNLLLEVSANIGKFSQEEKI